MSGGWRSDAPVGRRIIMIKQDITYHNNYMCDKVWWQKQFEFLEIISVDSVKVYKECNIGSAKPSNEILEK